MLKFTVLCAAACGALVACAGDPIDVQVTALSTESGAKHLDKLRVRPPRFWESKDKLKLVDSDQAINASDVVRLPLTGEPFTLTSQTACVHLRDGEGLKPAEPDAPCYSGGDVIDVVQGAWVAAEYVAVLRDGAAIGYLERTLGESGRLDAKQLGERVLVHLKGGAWPTAQTLTRALLKLPNPPKFFASLDRVLSEEPKWAAPKTTGLVWKDAEGVRYVTAFGVRVQGEILPVGELVHLVRDSGGLQEVTVDHIARVLVAGALSGTPTITNEQRTLKGPLPSYALSKDPPTSASIDAAIAATQDKQALLGLRGARHIFGEASPTTLDAFIAAAVAAEDATLLMEALRPRGSDNGLPRTSLVLGCVGDPNQATFSDGSEGDGAARLNPDAFGKAPHCVANYDPTAPCEPQLTIDHDCGSTAAECTALGNRRKRELAERTRAFNKEVIPPYKRAITKLAAYKNPAFAVPAEIMAKNATPDGPTPVVVYRIPKQWFNTGPCEFTLDHVREKAEVAALQLSPEQARSALWLSIGADDTVGWRYGVAFTDKADAVKSWLSMLGAGDGTQAEPDFTSEEAPVVPGLRCENTCESD